MFKARSNEPFALVQTFLAFLVSGPSYIIHQRRCFGLSAYHFTRHRHFRLHWRCFGCSTHCSLRLGNVECPIPWHP